MDVSEQPVTVALVSLGCPKNLIDSERMLAGLAEAGCVVGAPMDDADVIVVNTCGFLAAAREESLEVVAEAVEQKRSGRASRVILAGCLGNRDGERLYELAPGIDAVVGVNDRDRLVEAVAGDSRRTMLSPCNGRILPDAGRFRLTPRHTAYLRIGEGCSQQCSFCTIPAIRGPFRSKPPGQVLDEAAELVADGAVELNVIAQDTTSYGTDRNEPGVDLAGLLGRLDALDGARWIRLLYTYPRRFTDALIDRIAESERVVPYVDLPLQHVSDKVLRAMRRGVTGGQTRDLLGKLRERIPHLVLRTTLIVGFPGEGQREFAELKELVETFDFDALGVFEFSPEEGTPAAELPQQVPEDVRAERAEAIMLAQQQRAFEKNRRRVGEPIEVLVDGQDPDGRCVGRSYGQAPDVDSLCILTDPRPAGTFVRGTVTDWEDYDLVVTPVPTPY